MPQHLEVSLRGAPGTGKTVILASVRQHDLGGQLLGYHESPHVHEQWRRLLQHLVPKSSPNEEWLSFTLKLGYPPTAVALEMRTYPGEIHNANDATFVESIVEKARSKPTIIAHVINPFCVNAQLTLQAINSMLPTIQEEAHCSIGEARLGAIRFLFDVHAAGLKEELPDDYVKIAGDEDSEKTRREMLSVINYLIGHQHHSQNVIRSILARVPFPVVIATHVDIFSKFPQLDKEEFRRRIMDLHPAASGRPVKVFFELTMRTELNTDQAGNWEVYPRELTPDFPRSFFEWLTERANDLIPPIAPRTAEQQARSNTKPSFWERLFGCFAFTVAAFELVDWMLRGTIDKWLDRTPGQIVLEIGGIAVISLVVAKLSIQIAERRKGANGNAISSN